MNQVKRYVPEILFNKLSDIPYKNKEHLFVVCDMIYRQSVFRKNDEQANEFIDIPRKYFCDILDKYKRYIDFLITNNLIECDNTYSIVNGKALGYRFHKSIISKIIPVEIRKKTLSNKIITNRNKRLNLVCDSLKPYRDHFIETFKIDIDGAESHLNDWFNNEMDKCLNMDQKLNVISKYNSIYMRLRSIADGDLHFNRNQTNDRIDTNLTSLKSEYKKFITTKNLWQVDIVNSQPFFLCLYLYSYSSYVRGFCVDQYELLKYKNWTSNGNFYEEFKNEYEMKYSKDITREEIKELMFKIYYSKNGSFKKEKEVFKSIFPTIYTFIESQKVENHSEFAIKLQKIESSFCIDVVCEKLNEMGIKYYTIHDAWLVDEKHIGDVNNLIIDCFDQMYGITPELKIEKIN
jgi:hypothetical protein